MFQLIKINFYFIVKTYFSKNYFKNYLVMINATAIILLDFKYLKSSDKSD